MQRTIHATVCIVSCLLVVGAGAGLAGAHPPGPDALDEDVPPVDPPPALGLADGPPSDDSDDLRGNDGWRGGDGWKGDEGCLGNGEPHPRAPSGDASPENDDGWRDGDGWKGDDGWRTDGSCDGAGDDWPSENGRGPPGDDRSAGGEGSSDPVAGPDEDDGSSIFDSVRDGDGDRWYPTSGTGDEASLVDDSTASDDSTEDDEEESAVNENRSQPGFGLGAAAAALLLGLFGRRRLPGA